MAGLDAELDAALKAMESSFHVRLIGTFASDLIWAPADTEATTWLAQNYPDFDQFPVRQGDSTVGILLRQGEYNGKTVRQAMLPLSEGVIVSADMPIADLIPELRENHFRLILRGGRLDGVATQSDLLKLPVRLVAFALITHLEQVMASLIAGQWQGDAWLSLLGQGRQDKISAKLALLSSRRMNPPLLELTEFADKRDLCKRLVEGDKSKFIDELHAIGGLRDQLAHAATFIDPTKGQSAVREFVNQFESAKRWIHELAKLVTRIRGRE
jgi:CBS domain-containing protein